MTRDEAVAVIQLQLAFRTTLASEIATAMQMEQVMLENGPTKPWFLISEDSYITTTADEARIPLPTDFLEETEEAVFHYIPTTVSADSPEVPLVKGIFDQLRSTYADTTTGTIETGPPEAYALLGNYFRIFPVPDDTYTLHMIYYKRDDTLSAGTVENGFLKWNPKLLMGKAGKTIAGGPLRDKDAWAVFDQWEKEGRLLLMSQNVAREVGNLLMQVGGPH